MTERYPDDATLLGLTQDSATGAAYIPTGLSPYYLEFRRLVQRMLLASQRANDLRVYQDGDLTVGVRAGRCVINNTSVSYAGATGQALTAGSTHRLWLIASGALVISTASWPADRTTYLPLAQVMTGASAIQSIDDYRGQAFLAVPGLSFLGLTASASAINTALASASASVTSANLNTLTAGPDSSADALHTHTQVPYELDEEAYFTLFNTSSDSAAGVALCLSLPNRLPDDLVLAQNTGNGFLSQRYNGVTYNMAGVVCVPLAMPGNLTASQTGKLAGVVPVNGVVSRVILSVGTNMVSSLGTDGVEVVAKVKGTALTTTHPRITSAAGSGFRSTAQGHGTAGVVKTDSTRNVLAGDTITVDLNRTAAGSISVEANDVAVLVVIRVNQPE